MSGDPDRESSMLYWWPKVKDLDVPQPRTYFVKVDQKEIIDVLNMERESIPQAEEIKRFADSFSYPVFVRSDHISNKHGWENTCYVGSRDDIMKHVYQITEDACMMGMGGEIPTSAVFVREFVPLEMAGFTVFYGNFPVSKEVRCFIRDGSKECMHPYWFEDAVYAERDTVKKMHTGEPVGEEDWKKMMADMNVLTDADLSEIDRHLGLVGEQFEGYWSVDFAKGVDGRWYLIDMARGEVSFHLPGCRHCPAPPGQEPPVEKLSTEADAVMLGNTE